MKRWAALTVLLYLVVLMVLTAPVIALAFSPSWSGREGVSFEQALQFYADGCYWLWLAVMGTGQALLLLLPLDLCERRLPPRRPLFVPVLAATFFLANLCAAGLVAALCAVFRDQGLNVIEFVGEFVSGTTEWNPVANGALQAAGTSARSPSVVLFSGALTIITGFWVVWALVFFRFLKSDNPDALLARLTRWLLRGSILELLVAVPSHIIVRRRNDCCAPGGTFWGITMGISVMLLCFGPGVFFLFAKRCQRLRPRQAKPPEAGREK
jgi:hypothetical protein